MAELDATVCDAESLEAMITGGDSYTATQLYVGQIRRLQAADDYLEAEAFGARGVSALVAEGEVANATNIALKVVESMTTRKAAIDEKAYARLIGMVEAYGVTGCPAPPAQVRTQKLAMLRAACKLAASSAPLQATYARELAADGQLAAAARVFASADAPAEYAMLLKRWAAEGYAGESDLFTARAVLHLLATGRAEQAGTLYEALGAPDATPLEHFLGHVLELLRLTRSYRVGSEGGRLAFDALIRSYSKALTRDQNVMKLAQAAGARLFRWEPPQTPMQSMMKNMMKMFEDPQAP